MSSASLVKQQRTAGLVTGSAAPAWVLCTGLTPAGPVWISAAVVASLLLSGLLLLRRDRSGRAAATIAIGGFVAATAPALLTSPAGALAVWFVVAWLLSQLWLIPGLPPGRRLAQPELLQLARTVRARTVLRMTALGALLAAFSASEPSPADRLAIAAAVLVGAGFSWRARPLPALGARRAAVLALLTLAALLTLGTTRGTAAIALVFLSLLCVTVAALTRPPRRPEVLHPVWWERVLEHPARQLVASFFALVVFGTILLALPLAAADPGEAHSLVDAAFTSVSAVCVTGLVVLDTPTEWSRFGLATILLLIQLGGLGIMTFATAILGAIGGRLSLRQEAAVAELTGGESRRSLHLGVRRILRVTFIAEAAGATILSLRFLAHGDAVPEALWRGVFTAVSAFCNAGFALQSDSLIGYAADAMILHTVALLIILGGISPAAVTILPALVRRGRIPLQFHVVLTTTAILLALGTVLIAATEWNHTLAGLTFLDKWHNAWFQSVTLRTAGFNSIDFAAISPATTTLGIIWMFIGGSPGGTAGGIKTTTLAVLVMAVYASMRGQRDIVAFGRSIPHATVYRAASVTTLGVISVVLVLWSVQLTQDLSPVPALFETVSALGTVGLSMGATAALDEVGKIIIMVAMFAGRVGPLTLFVFLLARRGPPAVQYPPEPVDCG